MRWYDFQICTNSLQQIIGISAIELTINNNSTLIKILNIRQTINCSKYGIINYKVWTIGMVEISHLSYFLTDAKWCFFMWVYAILSQRWNYNSISYNMRSRNLKYNSRIFFVVVNVITQLSNILRMGTVCLFRIIQNNRSEGCLN